MFGGLFDYFFLEVSSLNLIFTIDSSPVHYFGAQVTPGGGVEPKVRYFPQEKSSKNGYLQKPWRSSDLKILGGEISDGPGKKNRKYHMF